ncbi:MAG: hypothetical protein IT329_01720 [Caldilineaceae bacterium]|nr:hypothetical protein [Caldilineaceae bacterium]
MAHAQAPERWSSPAKVPSYKQFTEEPPLLFADQNHTIHAFNSQPGDDGGPEVVWYRQWTLAQGWSALNDVIVAGDKDVELLDLFVDARARVHLVMRVETNIFYAWAPLAAAGRAPAWSTPIVIGRQALPPFSATIAGDAQGSHLFVLYGGDPNGKGVYWVMSSDGGETWSGPETLFLTAGEDQVAAGLDAIWGQDRRLHAVWNVFNSLGTGVAGYYARLDPAAGTWGMPMELDEGGIQLGIEYPKVFEYQGDLLLTFYNGKTNQNYWRRSSGDGAAWSEPALISPRHIGKNGPVSLAADSSDRLHLFFAERIDDDNHGVWHSLWTGAGWTEPIPVVRGPRVIDRIGGNGFDPHSPSALLVNGNLLFVVWATDGGAGSNGAWFAYTTLGTPELPTVTLPSAALPSAATPQPQPAATPLPAATPTPTAQPMPALSNRPAPRTAGPARPLLVGLAPVTLLVAAAFLRHRVKQRGYLSH